MDSIHPAVAPIKTQVLQKKLDIESKERRHEKLTAEIKEDKGELKKLRDLYKRARQMFEPDSIKRSEPDEDGPAPAREPSERRPVGEETYSRFRAWVRNEEHVWTVAQAAAALQLSTNPIRACVDQALKLGSIEEAGPYRPPGFNGGALPMGYRYVKEAAELGPIGSSGEIETPASVEPVAGTGHNGKVSNALDKDWLKITQAARNAGARLERMGSGHIKMSMPGKRSITLSGTPGDVNGAKRAKNDMRAAGYPL